MAGLVHTYAFHVFWGISGEKHRPAVDRAKLGKGRANHLTRKRVLDASLLPPLRCTAGQSCTSLNLFPLHEVGETPLLFCNHSWSSFVVFLSYLFILLSLPFLASRKTHHTDTHHQPSLHLHCPAQRPLPPPRPPAQWTASCSATMRRATVSARPRNSSIQVRFRCLICSI